MSQRQPIPSRTAAGPPTAASRAAADAPAAATRTPVPTAVFYPCEHCARLVPPIAKKFRSEAFLAAHVERRHTEVAAPAAVAAAAAASSSSPRPLPAAATSEEAVHSSELESSVAKPASAQRAADGASTKSSPATATATAAASSAAAAAPAPLVPAVAEPFPSSSTLSLSAPTEAHADKSGDCEDATGVDKTAPEVQRSVDAAPHSITRSNVSAATTAAREVHPPQKSLQRPVPMEMDDGEHKDASVQPEATAPAATATATATENGAPSSSPAADASSSASGSSADFAPAHTASRSSATTAASTDAASPASPAASYAFADLSTPASRYRALSANCPPVDSLRRLIRVVAREEGSSTMEHLRRDPLMVAKLFALPPSNSSGGGGGNLNLKKIMGVIKEFARAPAAAPFHEVLTAERLEEYGSSMSAYLSRTGGVAPIDFTSIHAKLAASKPTSLGLRSAVDGTAADYPNAVEPVVTDVLSVLLNAARFNPPGHPVYASAIELSEKLPRVLGALRRVLEVDTADIVCLDCGAGDSCADDPRGLLMRCESCGFWLHQSCADVAVVPKASWYCKDCLAHNRKLQRKGNEGSSASAAGAGAAGAGDVSHQHFEPRAPSPPAAAAATPSSMRVTLGVSDSADMGDNMAPSPRTQKEGSGSKRKHTAPLPAEVSGIGIVDHAAASSAAAAVAAAPAKRHRARSPHGAVRRSHSPPASPIDASAAIVVSERSPSPAGSASSSTAAAASAAADAASSKRARPVSPDGRWTRLGQLHVNGAPSLFSPAIEWEDDEATPAAAAAGAEAASSAAPSKKRSVRGDDESALHSLRTDLDSAMRVLVATSERIADLQETQRVRKLRAARAQQEEQRRQNFIIQIGEVLAKPVESFDAATPSAAKDNGGEPIDLTDSASSSAAAAAATPATVAELTAALSRYRQRFSALRIQSDALSAELASAKAAAASALEQHEALRRDALAIHEQLRTRLLEQEGALAELKARLLQERHSRIEAAREAANHRSVLQQLQIQLDQPTVTGHPIPERFGTTLIEQITRAQDRQQGRTHQTMQRQQQQQQQQHSLQRPQMQRQTSAPAAAASGVPSRSAPSPSTATIPGSTFHPGVPSSSASPPRSRDAPTSQQQPRPSIASSAFGGAQPPPHSWSNQRPPPPQQQQPPLQLPQAMRITVAQPPSTVSGAASAASHPTPSPHPQPPPQLPPPPPQQLIMDGISVLRLKQTPRLHTAFSVLYTRLSDYLQRPSVDALAEAQTARAALLQEGVQVDLNVFAIALRRNAQAVRQFVLSVIADSINGATNSSTAEGAMLQAAWRERSAQQGQCSGQVIGAANSSTAAGSMLQDAWRERIAQREQFVLPPQQPQSLPPPPPPPSLPSGFLSLDRGSATASAIQAVATTAAGNGPTTAAAAAAADGQSRGPTQQQQQHRATHQLIQSTVDSMMHTPPPPPGNTPSILTAPPSPPLFPRSNSGPALLPPWAYSAPLSSSASNDAAALSSSSHAAAPTRHPIPRAQPPTLPQLGSGVGAPSSSAAATARDATAGASNISLPPWQQQQQQRPIASKPPASALLPPHTAASRLALPGAGAAASGDTVPAAAVAPSTAAAAAASASPSDSEMGDVDYDDMPQLIDI